MKIYEKLNTIEFRDNNSSGFFFRDSDFGILSFWDNRFSGFSFRDTVPSGLRVTGF